jgi:hypothetical protein
LLHSLLCCNLVNGHLFWLNFQLAVDMTHCSLLMAACPEQPTGEQPFLLFRSVWAKLPRVVGALTSLAVKLLVVSSFAWAVAGSSTMSWSLFFRVWWKTWLFVLRSWALGPVSGLHWHFPYSPVVAGLSPLCHCCISAASVISYWTSVFWGCLYNVILGPPVTLVYI